VWHVHKLVIECIAKMKASQMISFNLFPICLNTHSWISHTQNATYLPSTADNRPTHRYTQKHTHTHTNTHFHFHFLCASHRLCVLGSRHKKDSKLEARISLIVKQPKSESKWEWESGWESESESNSGPDSCCLCCNFGFATAEVKLSVKDLFAENYDL